MRNWVTRQNRSTWRRRLAPRRISHFDKRKAVTIMSKATWLAVPASLALLMATGCSRTGPQSSYRVYISNEGSGDLTVIDPVKMEALATVPLGKRARGIHPSADAKLIFVT